jgi:hypothetical protein
MSIGLRAIAASLAFVLLAAAPVPAQPPSSQTPTAPPNVAPPQPTDPAAMSPSAPVTLTGCLERGKAVPAESRPGAPPLPGAGQTPFVLRTLGPPSSSAPAASNPSATDPKAQPKAEHPVIYALVAAKDNVRFDAHVGHKVTLTGTLRAAMNQQPGMSNQGISPSTPSGSTGMETAPRPAGDPAAANAPTITQPIFVDSLTMVDTSCSESR